ncbi:protein AF1q [Nelusetta ayraudi]|uniref:protein AF1q n=1 Tax=Nelusetta ayraudi TaxID=303726 RepID=UPI003F6FEEE3
MQTSSSQYDSFLFWRQPIPELDLSELEEMGGAISQPASKKPAGRGQEEEEDVLTQFSSFNYWRAPIADIHILLADL